MQRRTLNIMLLLLLLLTLGLHWTVRPSPAQTNREFIPEMVRTPRYNAYSVNKNFADGKTLQRPELGTIPRGFLPLRYSATPDDAIRAGDSLQNPLPQNDPALLSRGKTVFLDFCTPCHGVSAKGDGPVVQHGYPAPPSLLAENTKKIKDGQIFHILTYGQKNMPPYATLLSREDRWNVVAYIRSLQKQATPVPTGGQP